MITQANADRWFMVTVRHTRLVGEGYLIIAARDERDVPTLIHRLIGKYVMPDACHELRNWHKPTEFIW